MIIKAEIMTIIKISFTEFRLARREFKTKIIEKKLLKPDWLRGC